MTYVKPAHSTGLRLHFNENTAGCSPAVLEALRSLGRTDASLYPDYSAVTAATESYFGVDAGWVQLTNGLDEGLHVVAQLVAREARGARVLLTEPAFEMYAACAEGVGLRATHIQPEPDFRFPMEAVLAAIGPDTRLIYLTDPNNPTGLAIPPGAVERIAATAPNALVLVDEAYAEFSGRTFIGPALDRHRNLIVGRTFAKAHGLAALRVGALIAHPATLGPLRRILPPYNVNIAAVFALRAALEDRAYLDWYVAQSVESRRLIYSFCDRHDFKYWKSEANFVLVRVGDDAGTITDDMVSRGVLIRDRSRSPGCAGCIRLTAGVVEHTTVCLSALEETLASRTY
jgi:histidinol-phosphate aminotransferase